jgi:hypothetical protein
LKVSSLWEDTDGLVGDDRIVDAYVTTANLACLNRFKNVVIDSIHSASIDGPMEFRSMSCKELTVHIGIFMSCYFDWETLKDLTYLEITEDWTHNVSFGPFGRYSFLIEPCLDAPERIRVVYLDTCLYNDDDTLDFDITAWNSRWSSELKLHLALIHEIRPGWSTLVYTRFE